MLLTRRGYTEGEEKGGGLRRDQSENGDTRMKIIENQTFDQERALYGARNVKTANCRFDGPADGESAFKKCANIAAENCFFNLRYPFWHDRGLVVKGCELTESCRAALWYSRRVRLEDTRLHGIKALRECSGVELKGCDIRSPEFGWSSKKVTMEDCTPRASILCCGLPACAFAT